MNSITRMGIIVGILLWGLHGVDAVEEVPSTSGLIELAPSAEIADGLVITGPHVVWKCVINGTLSAGLAGGVGCAEEKLMVPLQGASVEGAHSYISVLDQKDGAVAWIRTVSGLASSPSFSSERTYYATLDGVIAALSSVDGSQIWKTELPDMKDVPVRWSPSDYNDLVYVGYENGTIQVLNKSDGSPMWSFAMKGVPYANPLFMDGSMFVCSSKGKVCALEPTTGAVKWEATIRENIFFLNLLYEEQFLIIVWCPYEPGGALTGKDRDTINVTVFDALTGATVWTAGWDTQETVSWPIKAFGKLFVSVGKTIRAIDIRSGQEAWTFTSDAVFFPAIEVRGETLYGAHQATPADMTAQHFVFALDLKTGKELWRYTGDVTGRMMIEEGFLSSTSVGVQEATTVPFVFFLDATTGTEKGKVVIRAGEQFVGGIIVRGRDYFMTTRDQTGNTYLYKLQFE